MNSPVILCHRTILDGEWTIKIHTPHGSKEHDRHHVHISKRGVRGQYSWNSDGTRHDAGKFPKSEQCMQSAKRIASEILNIDASKLKFATVLSEFNHAIVIDNATHSHVITFTVRRSKVATVLYTDDLLVIVIEEF